MNGRHALIRTLVDCGVDVCFTNPGTSEMHFVAALDDVPEMRGDARPVRGRRDRRGRRLRPHGRPAGRRRCCTSDPASATASPTCTTPAGRARRSSTSSATTRRTTSSTTRRSQSDIDALAGNVSGWIRSSSRPATVGDDAADAVAAAIGAARAGRDARSCPPTCRGSTAPRPVGRRAHPAAVGRRRRRRSATSPRCSRSGEPAALLSVGGGRAGRAAGRAGRIAPPTGRQAAGRGVPDPARAGRGHRPRSSASGTSPSSPRCQLDGLSPPRPRRRRVAGLVLRLSRQGERPRARRMRGAHARRARSDDVARRSPQLADAVGAATPTPVAAGAADPTARPARSPPRPSPRPSARSLPEGAIVVRRGATPPDCASRAPPPARRATTG